MVELVQINYQTEKPTVLGRDLHKALEVKSDYTHWFNRMVEYGFEEGVDYLQFVEKDELESNQEFSIKPKTNHQLTLDMAKEIAMIQRTPIGKKVRQYFIEAEKQLREPPQPMSTLDMFELQVKLLREQEKQLNQLKEQSDKHTEQLERQDERIKMLEGRAAEKIFPYPNHNTARQFNSRMYLICTDMQQEEEYASLTIENLMETLKDQLIDDIKKELGRSVLDEKEECKQYYMKVYIEAKSKTKTPSASILRPAQIKSLSLVSYLSTSQDLITFTKLWLDKRQSKFLSL